MAGGALGSVDGQGTAAGGWGDGIGSAVGEGGEFERGGVRSTGVAGGWAAGTDAECGGEAGFDSGGGAAFVSDRQHCGTEPGDCERV